MCIKDPINENADKNGKYPLNGVPKIKLWNYTKKTHFPVFATNFSKPWWSWKIFFANFQNLWGIRDGLLYLKMWKSQHHRTLMHSNVVFWNCSTCPPPPPPAAIAGRMMHQYASPFYLSLYFFPLFGQKESHKENHSNRFSWRKPNEPTQAARAEPVCAGGDWVNTT